MKNNVGNSTTVYSTLIPDACACSFMERWNMGIGDQWMGMSQWSHPNIAGREEEITFFREKQVF